MKKLFSFFERLMRFLALLIGVAAIHIRLLQVQRGADAIRGTFSSTYIEKVAKKLPSDTEI